MIGYSSNHPTTCNRCLKCCQKILKFLAKSKIRKLSLSEGRSGSCNSLTGNMASHVGASEKALPLFDIEIPVALCLLKFTGTRPTVLGR